MNRSKPSSDARITSSKVICGLGIYEESFLNAAFVSLLPSLILSIVLLTLSIDFCALLKLVAVLAIATSCAAFTASADVTLVIFAPVVGRAFKTSVPTSKIVPPTPLAISGASNSPARFACSTVCHCGNFSAILFGV